MPVDITPEEWARATNLLERLDRTVNGNGRPSLKEEIILYVDRRDRHKEQNAKQDVSDLREDMDEKHLENKETNKEFRAEIKVLSRIAWIGFGIVVTLQALGLLQRIHF